MAGVFEEHRVKLVATAVKQFQQLDPSLKQEMIEQISLAAVRLASLPRFRLPASSHAKMDEYRELTYVSAILERTKIIVIFGVLNSQTWIISIATIADESLDGD